MKTPIALHCKTKQTGRYKSRTGSSPGLINLDRSLNNQSSYCCFCRCINNANYPTVSTHKNKATLTNNHQTFNGAVRNREKVYCFKIEQTKIIKELH